jgi:hypothetical protein
MFTQAVEGPVIVLQSHLGTALTDKHFNALLPQVFTAFTHMDEELQPQELVTPNEVP